MRQRLGGWLLTMFLGLGVLLTVQHSAVAQTHLQIGLGKNLFRDVSPALIQIAAAPFNMLMRQQAGVEGTVVLADSAHELGELLQQGKLQLAVLHGFEYAWVQQKYPQLKPLVIIINQHRQLSANLVVSRDNPVQSLLELKGCKLALPLRTREHCHLYLEKVCLQHNIQSDKFFESLPRPSSKHKALDEILRGKIQAAVIDGVSLEDYRHLKPDAHSRLKIVHQSEPFPAAVLVYRTGVVEETTLQRVRGGLLEAGKTESSRDMMALWGVSAFEAIPGDYQQTLNNILKAYPSPVRPVQVATPANDVRAIPTSQSKLP